MIINEKVLYANNEQYRIAEDGRWHNNADCNMNVTWRDKLKCCCINDIIVFMFIMYGLLFTSGSIYMHVCYN